VSPAPTQAGRRRRWRRCIDPLDGTCNFANGYRGFCCSVGVLRHATPVAGCVIEFTGGPGNWGTRTYAGGLGGRGQRRRPLAANQAGPSPPPCSEHLPAPCCCSEPQRRGDGGRPPTVGQPHKGR